MSALQIWCLALLAWGLLFGLAQLSRRLRWPEPPLGLPRIAVVVWALARSLPLNLLPVDLGRWLPVLDDLMLAYAAIPMLLWAALEVPARYRLWRSPPKLLQELLSLAMGGLATVLIVQELAHLNLLGLVTTSAVATAMIGLAAQEALKDLFAGLELQLGDEFSAGDWIELEEGTRGIVQSISWRDTSLRDLDGNLRVVPNSMITAKVLTRIGAFDAVSHRFTVGLDYAFPPARARDLLLNVVQQHPQVLKDPAAEVRLLEFQDSAIAYEIQVWSREWGELAARRLRGELMEQTWYALNRVGQSIPYPVRDVRPRPPADAPAAEPLPDLEACCAGLRGNALFADLTAAQLQCLVADSRLDTFGPGELVVKEGDDGDSLYLVLRGRVSILKRVDDGRIMPVVDLGEGQIFGEMTLFLNTPRSASVRSATETLLLQVDRPAISQLLEDSPQLLEGFARLVAARQAELEAINRQAQRTESDDLLAAMRRLLVKAFSSG